MKLAAISLLLSACVVALAWQHHWAVVAGTELAGIGETK